MNNRYTIAITGLVLVAASFGVVFAHGTENHGKKSMAADAQMKKLHAMMPMFSLASAGLETALEKGEVTVVEAEAEKIITAIPDLKKSKPHKNIQQRKKFVELATSLEKAVASAVDLAKKGDFAGAKSAFKDVEKACAACHARFRD